MASRCVSCVSRPLAEDLLQEAFVSIWHHAGSYTAAKAKPQTWLTSIVRNRCLDQLRRREPDTMTMTRDEDETEMDFEALGPTPEELLLSGADAHSVRDLRRRSRRRPRSRPLRSPSFEACRTPSWRCTCTNLSAP